MSQNVEDVHQNEARRVLGAMKLITRSSRDADYPEGVT